MTSEPEPALRLSGVSRTYNDGHPIHALRATDLVVRPGDYATITGPSGSGKSTLLNIIGLLDRPTSGSYQVRGVETADAGENLRTAIRGQLFGFVFQAFHLLAGRTAVENVELGMLYGPDPPRKRRILAREAIDLIGLSPRAHADPRTLSGGERQRVAIARAIATRPQVLLCDEPTGNLDSANTENVLELISELHSTGLTVIMITHDEVVAARGTRRFVANDGLVEEVDRCPA
jgi:putative ABC transport system ATP-binding protein